MYRMVKQSVTVSDVFWAVDCSPANVAFDRDTVEVFLCESSE